MNKLAPLHKWMFALGTLVFATSCHHDKERVVVVQPSAPAPQPQQVVIQRDTPPPTQPANAIVVREAPPPPRNEEIPSQPPAPENVWAPGHWEYQNNNYVWIPGHWLTRPQPNAEYVPPHWENRPDGWAYVQGYWR